MSTFIALTALSAISGLLYRLGGSDKTWHGKERDWGCAVCVVLGLWVVLHRFSVWYFPVFLLSWGALSTYWKGDAVDVKAVHWFLHGLGCGLACLPLVVLGVPLWLILTRAILLGGLMTWVSEASEDVFIEEFSRGGLLVATLSLFA